MLAYRNDTDVAFGLLDSIPSDAEIAAAQTRWVAEANAAMGGLESRYGSTVNQWAGSVRAGVNLAQSIADGKNWQGTPEEAKEQVKSYAQQACATLGTVSSALQTACEATMTVLNAIAGWIVDAWPAYAVDGKLVAYNEATNKIGYSGGEPWTGPGYDSKAKFMFADGWAVFYKDSGVEGDQDLYGVPQNFRVLEYLAYRRFGVYTGTGEQADWAKAVTELREISALPGGDVAMPNPTAAAGSASRRLADFDRWFRSRWLNGRERIASLNAKNGYRYGDATWSNIGIGRSSLRVVWWAVKWTALPAEVRRSVYANLVADTPDVRGDLLAGNILSMARIGMQPRQIETEFLTYILANKPVPELDIRRAGPSVQKTAAPGSLYKAGSGGGGDSTEKSEGLGTGSKVALVLLGVGALGLGAWVWSRRSAGLAGRPSRPRRRPRFERW